MPITVQIPSALRRHTNGIAKITCSVTDLNGLFSELDAKFPELKPHLRDGTAMPSRTETKCFLCRRSPAADSELTRLSMTKITGP